MTISKLLAFSIIGFLMATPSMVQGQAFSQPDWRTWTNTNGVAIEATLLSIQAKSVTLRTHKGNADVPLAQLSRADQVYVQNSSPEFYLIPENSTSTSGVRLVVYEDEDNKAHEYTVTATQAMIGQQKTLRRRLRAKRKETYVYLMFNFGEDASQLSLISSVTGIRSSSIPPLPQTDLTDLLEALKPFVLPVDTLQASATNFGAKEIAQLDIIAKGIEQDGSEIFERIEEMLWEPDIDQYESDRQVTKALDSLLLWARVISREASKSPADNLTKLKTALDSSVAALEKFAQPKTTWRYPLLVHDNIDDRGVTGTLIVKDSGVPVSKISIAAEGVIDRFLKK